MSFPATRNANQTSGTLRATTSMLIPGTTFTRNDSLPDGKGGSLQPSMQLNSAPGAAYGEPKVASRYGYTVGGQSHPTFGLE